MCGIAGYLSPGRVPDDVLERMTKRLGHRGPDAQDHYRDGPVALGHRRLSVIDVEGSPQPMSTPDGVLTIVFNGEIYNFAAVRETLAARGHKFRTRGDTEVLLYAWREYGPAMLQHLQGMFAFALWDRRAQRLFIARDHLGVKPLYYHWDGATLVFGSELKALIEHPGVRRELDLDALGLFLECQYIPSPKTVYRGVRKLEPGHAMIVEDGKLSIERYWRPDYSAKLWLDEVEALARLEAELRRSVESMLVSDVPLGSFLSGGVDSSVVSALMADIAKRPIDTFTLGFHGEGAASEHSHAALVSRRIGARNHVLMLDPSQMLAAFEDWTDAFDEPFADPAALPTMLLAKLTRRHVTVVLTGEGADEVFSGYGNYRKRVREERITRILGARLSPLRYLVRALPARARKDRLLKALVEPVSRRYVTIPMVFDPALHRSLLSPSFLAARDTCMADYAERFFEECNSPEYIDKLMYIDARLWLPDDLLTKVDRATMAYSLEARVPYLDHRFFEFCARLDPALKQHGRTGKYLLKKLAEKLLPREIVHRPKQGFFPPLTEWFAGRLKEEAQAAFSRLDKRGLFRPGALSALVTEHYSARRNHSGRLWALLVLEKWFGRYVPEFSL
ncbi:MAG TPA: asparagine synthase (glutamine-hydrolyzing) [Burkholderiales bacterium]|nr:asparagine synthase (glutamine-hydrolyzing) [Burkholderiales bacterium]